MIFARHAWSCFAFCTLLGLASPESSCAQEERWVQVVEDEAYEVRLDTRTFAAREGGRVVAWLRWQYHLRQSNDNLRYDRVLANTEYDCKRRRHKVTEMHYYNGDTIVRSVTQLPERWLSVIPDTVAEDLFTELCVRATRSGR